MLAHNNLGNHTMQPLKRRKLTNPPFRSPVKRNLSTATQPDSADHRIGGIPHESEHDHDNSQNTLTTPTDSPRPACHSKPLSDILHPDRAQHVALDKEYAALVQQLRNLKHQLNLAEQAWNLSKSDQVAQLESRVQKWQSVAQDAADHVYTLTQARMKADDSLGEWQRLHQPKHHNANNDAELSDPVCDCR